MKKNTSFGFYITLGLILSIGAPLLAFAQEAAFVPLTSLPGLPTTASAPSISIFLNYFYRLCIGAAAVIAVLQIMYSGFSLVRGSASGATNSDAKKRIQNSILGLVLVLSPYVFFSIINPSILKLDFLNDFSKLQTKVLDKVSTDPNAASNQVTDPQTLIGICKTYTSFAYVQDTTSGCSVKGPGYVKTDCCSPVAASGQICCSLSPEAKANETAPKNPSSQGIYSYDYFAEQSDYNGGKCSVNYHYGFSSQNSCSAAIGIKPSDSVYAIQNNCSGTNGIPTPSASYSAIKVLPACK